MSTFLPPIPQKIKQKSSSLSPILDRTIISNVQPNPLKNSERFRSKIDHTILEFNSELSWIDQINNNCLDLKAQDQTLLKLFMCIREEILILQEIGIKNELPNSTTNPCNQLHTATTQSIDVDSQYSTKSLAKYFQKVNQSNQPDFVSFDIASHFDFPEICRGLDDFRLHHGFIHSVENIPTIENTEGSLNLEKSKILVQPPPIPEKTIKRHLFPMSNLADSSISKNNGLSCTQSLICDPVLDQGWPKSKSFNSNAFISHTRKSSMTLSDLYDHLNPLTTTGNQMDLPLDTFMGYSTSCSNHVTENISKNSRPKRTPIEQFPMSKSNVDCKLSSLDSSPYLTQKNTQNIVLTDSENFEDNLLSNENIDCNKGRILRADSTPSLSSLIIVPKLYDVCPGGNSLDLSISSQQEEGLRNPEKLPAQPIKPKSPNKLLSIISRGISSGFIKQHQRTRTQKHSQSSNNFNEFDPILGVDQIRSCSTVNFSQENTRQSTSLMSPLQRHPPPIPPKFSKQTVIKSINLQQTWC